MKDPAKNIKKEIKTYIKGKYLIKDKIYYGDNGDKVIYRIYYDKNTRKHITTTQLVYNKDGKLVHHHPNHP